jgi:hypothetical protein
MKEENNNSIINDAVNNATGSVDFINAEDSIPSSPIFDEARKVEEQMPEAEEEIPLEPQESIPEEVEVPVIEKQNEKNDKVSVIIHSCFIIVLISAFVLVITIFANKNSSFKAFLKTNPISKAVFNTESSKEIEEETTQVEEQTIEESAPEEVQEDNNSSSSNNNSSSEAKTNTKKSSSSSKSSSGNSSSIDNNSSSNSSSSNGGSSSSGGSSSNSSSEYTVTHYAYLEKDGNNNINANGTIKRHEAARMLAKLNNLQLDPNGISPFTDVDSSTDNFQYIVAAHKAGYFKGYKNYKYTKFDGTYSFKPDNDLSRAESVTMIIYMMQSNKLPMEEKCEQINFTDINELDKVQRSIVLRASRLCLVVGSDDGKFYPDSPVKRVHFAIMLARANDRMNSKEDCPPYTGNNFFNDYGTNKDQYYTLLDASLTRVCKK